ncbi:MAG: hypothetical protein KF809_07370 [Chloroflexi bacterium]|nr:hypothetical protein [Chloroflexota bacterium]
MSRTVMRGAPGLVLALMALGLVGGVAAQGPSPGPSSSGAPAPPPSGLASSAVPVPSASAAVDVSPVPSSSAAPIVSCQDLLVALPATMGAGTLRAATSRGIEGIDPDDLLDPLLASLGRSRDDLCGVRFGYPPAAGPTGELLRIRDVAVDDLATRVGGALVARLRSYGAQVTDESVVVGEVTGLSIVVVADGQTSGLTVLGTGPDTVLLLPAGTDPAELLGALVKASTPET